MDQLKRTQLYDVHVKAGATMVDFGGWEMPIQYPEGIVAEHLYTRANCSLFDVSHMGRLIIEGKDKLAFLQHVLTSNAAALTPNKAQYCIIPDADGSAVDDAYLYLYDEDTYLLVVNASNIDKDIAHLNKYIKDFDCTIKNISGEWAAIAVQGPKTDEYMQVLSGGVPITEPKRNCLSTIDLEGHTVRASKTGYTGEPLGYEIYVKSEDAEWLWGRLLELGAKPAGLGARDTLRLEASMPLYGHEMGKDQAGANMPIFAVPLAKFAVSFLPEKGDFVGREALLAQSEAYKKIQEGDFSEIDKLPRRIRAITLIDRGVIRSGMDVYKGDKLVGWTTSGTMVPYHVIEGEGEAAVITEKTGKRPIGLCYIDSDIATDEVLEVNIRGKRVKAVVTTRHMSAANPPYVRPLIYSK